LNDRASTRQTGICWPDPRGCRWGDRSRRGGFLPLGAV